MHTLHEVQLPVLLSSRFTTPHPEQTPKRTKGQAMPQGKHGHEIGKVIVRIVPTNLKENSEAQLL